MIYVDIAGWIAAGLAIWAYFRMAGGKLALRWFNWSEFLASIPLAASAFQHRAFPALGITMSYGLVGLYGLVRR